MKTPLEGKEGMRNVAGGEYGESIIILLNLHCEIHEMCSAHINNFLKDARWDASVIEVPGLSVGSAISNSTS